MDNQKVKSELINSIAELMPKSKVCGELAAKTGYSIQYIHRWMTTDLIHLTIQEKALELLYELKNKTEETLNTLKSVKS